jgi:CRP/FNR family transcriptional regulator
MKRQGRSESSLPMPMSRTDLANYLGMTLECLSRVIARFARAGMITATRTQLTQHQPEQLAILAGHLDL